MKINFSKLSQRTASMEVEPRDIFMALPSKDKCYEYPRDVQSEVWKEWYSKRDAKNNIIKMNTGAGKTVVGLIILKCCLEEGKGPAVYVAPDNFLAQQVCSEAHKLGIRIATDENDYFFMSKKAILVINIHKLVNGKSVFGMRDEGNVPIGSVIIDDAHACFNTLSSQFAMYISSDKELYKKIAMCMSEPLKLYSDQLYHETVECGDPRSSLLVPFWIWQDKAVQIRDYLREASDDDSLKFNYPLFRDCLETCNCVISGAGIEITPKCIPIQQIKSFADAERRIFMSATLADDSVFVTSLGLDESEIGTVIAPEKANDIGDRLMLFPQVINRRISDDNIKTKLKDLSLNCNVVVIVPSAARGRFWSDCADEIVTTSNIDNCVQRLQSSHVGLCIFINKYDGIDLPDDACRILVIDGLPNTRNEYDSFVRDVNPSSKRLLSEQIQKIEQGLGRGVRSNNDYCVAVLMSRVLIDVLIRSEGFKYFSKATRIQFDLSRALWEQVLDNCENPSIDEIFNLADYSLNRDIDWISTSKDALSSVTYDKVSNIGQMSIAIRKAFDKSIQHEYHQAVAEIGRFKNEEQEHLTNEEKGFLLMLMAEYTNFFNREEAQQLLRSAYGNNYHLIRPIDGIQFQKLICRQLPQAQILKDYLLNNHLDENGYVLAIHAIVEKLSFVTTAAKVFEQAMRDISYMIGIDSSRPEQEQGRGPDNLWALGDGHYWVIECKNETIADTINKHDCNQLNGSIVWFDNEFNGNHFIRHPMMIHNSDTFDFACSPADDIRIMTPECLSRFRHSILDFAGCVATQHAVCDMTALSKLLAQHKLTGTSIVNEYTVRHKKK